MKRKVSVKNLRVLGQRIPDAMFREIAEELIPGDGPTESQRKHGAASKAQMMAALCETDKSWRDRVQKAALRKKAAATKQMAADNGYVLPEGDAPLPTEADKMWAAIRDKEERERTGVIPQRPYPPRVDEYHAIESLGLLDPKTSQYWPYGFVTRTANYSDPAYVAAMAAWNAETFDVPEWTSYKFTLADYYKEIYKLRKATAEDVNSIVNPIQPEFMRIKHVERDRPVVRAADPIAAAPAPPSYTFGNQPFDPVAQLQRPVISNVGPVQPFQEVPTRPAYVADYPPIRSTGW